MAGEALVFGQPAVTVSEVLAASQPEMANKFPVGTSEEWLFSFGTKVLPVFENELELFQLILFKWNSLE